MSGTKVQVAEVHGFTSGTRRIGRFFGYKSLVYPQIAQSWWQKFLKLIREAVYLFLLFMTTTEKITIFHHVWKIWLNFYRKSQIIFLFVPDLVPEVLLGTKVQAGTKVQVQTRVYTSYMYGSYWALVLS